MAHKIPGEHEKAVKDLRAKYVRTAARIQGILNALQPVGFTTSKAAAARRQVDALVTDLNRYARAWTKRWIPVAYKDGRDVTEGRLAIMGAKRLPRRVKANRHDKTTARLVDSVFRDLFKANRSIRKIAVRYCNLMARSAEGARELEIQALDLDMGQAEHFIARVAKSAVRNGTPRDKFQSRILEYLRRRLSGQDFITINGRNYNLKDYSELVARTNLRNAQTEATKNAAWDYGHDLVEVPAKDGSCEDCLDYEGKIYSLSGNDPEYPALEEQPPFHPRCRHYLRVTSRNILGQRGAA